MLNNHISLKKITPSYETNHHHIHRMDDHRPQRQRHQQIKNHNDMKKMSLPIILAVAAITATSYNCSDSKTDNPGWLWEISGNGLAQKSYLFGTCHGGGHSFTHEEIFGFEGVDEALSNVKTVYFETDLTVANRLAAKEMSIAEYLGCDKDTTKEDLMPEGVTYESLFDSVAQYQEVHQFLSQKMGVAEYWKRTPKYWFDLLSEYNSTKMYYGIRTADVVLYQEAIKRGIEIGQLESALQHVQWEKGPIIPKTRRQRPNIPLKFQAWMLYVGIHNNNDEIPEWVKGIEAAYLENDTCSLYDVLENHAKNDPDNPMMPNPLIPDSLSLTQAMNQAWFPVIEQNIAKGSCMVAVGARHLLGNKGLIAMLRRKGYTVEAVK